MAANLVCRSPLPAVAAGKFTACHANPQQMQRESKQTVQGRMVFSELHPVAALGTNLAAENLLYSPLDLKNTSSAGPGPHKVPAWMVALEALQCSPWSMWFG